MNVGSKISTHIIGGDISVTRENTVSAPEWCLISDLYLDILTRGGLGGTVVSFVER